MLHKSTKFLHMMVLCIMQNSTKGILSYTILRPEEKEISCNATHMFPCTLYFLCCLREQILRKHCIFLFNKNPVIFEHSQHVIFHDRDLPYICVNESGLIQDFMCDWEADEEMERGNHIHLLMMQEKIACLYLTENLLDSCNEVERGHCVQLSLCHPDRTFFQSIILPFPLGARQRETHQQLPFCL